MGKPVARGLAEQNVRTPFSTMERKKKQELTGIQVLLAVHEGTENDLTRLSSLGRRDLGRIPT